MAGRVEGDDPRGGIGADSSRCRRDAKRSDWVSNLSVASSAEVFQTSSPVSLSRACDIRVSKLSNFFASSSMDVVIWASNLVGFRGARSRSSPAGELAEGECTFPK